MVSVVAAEKSPLATRPDSTMISQAATPVAAPALADRVTVATASAKAQTAVIGISQPKVTAAAVTDTVLFLPYLAIGAGCAAVVLYATRIPRGSL